MAFSTAQPSASTLMVPEVCWSRPARMRSSVDFPQPLGPTMQTNSPGATREIDVVDARRPSPARWHIRGAGPRSRSPRRAAAPASMASRRRERVARQRQPGSLLSLFSSSNGPSFCDGVVDVARCPSGARPGTACADILFFDVPLVDVEHAGDVDLAVRAARRPGIFVQQLPARRGLGVDQLVDDLLAVRRRRDRPGNNRARRAATPSCSCCTSSGLAFAQSLLAMMTAMVIGCGCTSSSTSPNGTAMLLLLELPDERRDDDARRRSPCS